MNLSESSDPKTEPLQLGDVLKWVFARNPFYVISAALLLYAIYRLSIDPRLFATELGQLLFNFGSFQLYELLLVGTAVLLVRKQIAYDSALLVVLENLLVLVPFILISQALLIEGSVAAMLGFGAVALVVVRYAAIRKYFSRINLPKQLLVIGGVLLVVNGGLPLLVKMLHNEANTHVWEMKGATFYSAGWLVLMPLLLGVANLLPRPKLQGSEMIEKSYFPLVTTALWVLVTGAHLYSIGYVYGLVWNHAFLVPVGWAAAWTLWNRFYDFDLFDEEIAADLHNVLLIPVMIVPLFAGFAGEWNIFLVIALANALLFGVLAFRHENRTAFHLMLLSGALALGGLPQSIFENLHLDISRGKVFGGAFAAYIIVRALFSRNPRLGLVAGVITAIVSGLALQNVSGGGHVAAQLGFLFLLLHSMRWIDQDHSGAGVVRVIMSLLWVLHSVIWVAGDSANAWPATAAFATVAMGVYVAVRLIYRAWGPRIVPLAAGAILLSKPVLLAVRFVQDAPVGLIALGASLLLFAIGTAGALTRNRWNKNERSLSSSNQIINTTL